MYFAEDEYLAQRLQNEFNFFQGINSHSESKEKENHNPVDSKLEYLDPTPSIHDLFVKFDRKFFWNSLGTVEVKWSTRMTKCAGLCSFEKKGKVCVISLSAPLLSLRPRKDLVETLLHEMIHAYLFVTNNYRDREDHGPQFHKHMYRINKEAGTKITVYHTFHDEVEYYQKHIWRCNGPCQTKKPFFGFVKRAVNRAPGPSDFWWSKHKLECNGTYIKISEPEKISKKVTKTKKVQKSKNIRDYFTQPNISGKPGISTKTSNIMTLADLKVDASSGISNKMNSTSIVTNNIKEGKNTIPNKKTEKVPTSSTEALKMNTSSVSDVQKVVRSVWANKFVTQPGPSLVEQPCKKAKIVCPFCSENFSEEKIQAHICLKNQIPKKDPQDLSNNDCAEEPKTCPVCTEKVLSSEMNEHLENCLKCTFENEKDELNDVGDDDVMCESFPCPCCYKWFSESEMNSHIDYCLTLISLKQEVV